MLRSCEQLEFQMPGHLGVLSKLASLPPRLRISSKHSFTPIIHSHCSIFFHIFPPFFLPDFRHLDLPTDLRFILKQFSKASKFKLSSRTQEGSGVGCGSFCLRLHQPVCATWKNCGMLWKDGCFLGSPWQVRNSTLWIGGPVHIPRPTEIGNQLELEAGLLFLNLDFAQKKMDQQQQCQNCHGFSLNLWDHVCSRRFC